MKDRLIFGFIALAIILAGSACTKNSSSSMPALNITVKNVWLSDAVDVDGDGYASYMNMNLDLDVNRNSIDVMVQIGVRLYDPADTAGYYLYFESPEFTIGGDGPHDAVYTGIGAPNIELPQAEWDFILLVFTTSNLVDPVLAIDPSTLPAFGQVAVEEAVTDGGIVIYDAWWPNLEDTDGDGYFSKATLGVDVDIPGGSNDFVYLDLFVKTSASTEYINFAQTEFFSITGESENDAIEINLDDFFAHDEYDFRIASMVYNGDVVEDMVDKSTGGFIGDELGAMPLELDSEDIQQPLTVYFTNQVFTPINIGVLNYGSKTIPVGGNVSYDFGVNPGTIRYSASTSGKTNTGTQIGKLVTWQATLNVSGQSTLTYNLVLSSTEFFMYMKNSGTKNLTPVYVNYDLTDQIMDNILIPPDNITYNIGYYNAHANTEVRAYWSGEPDYYSYWQQGVHFTLPFTQNQSVILLNTSKNGKTTTTGIVNMGQEQSEPGALPSGELSLK